ncbi:catalase HPII [Klebsiella pneumoniae]|uniref:catalase HPII n=1 Tax=Klebsiella pneumoniae TaxID=573 RepID=UPI000B3D98FE|nr:catalase HPII [Klebsiella pneumoniae]
MSDKHPNPHQQQAPVHDSEEAQPGLDSLAPDDREWRPTPKPTAPGVEPTAPGSLKAPDTHNSKLDSLEAQRKGGEDFPLTTNQGVRIADDQNSLRAGSRGPTLLEDFILREKITHFDHERIPERIVHARGSAAHGYFQPYKSLAALTKADFLSSADKITPVFVRFSTVQGGAGSADTVRDIRGFATKFYTDEGIFDLVGNNTPVFFIQDAMKFPDFVHAVKPEPHWAIPQGQSAHDTFWDYVSLQPETLHNVMWAMSDRGIPRSYRTMEGFGIHTFRLINAEGKATFVRFHWKPVAGKASLVWDEAQKLTGRDPDFHRRDLWEAIEAEDYPEFELGLQLIPEENEFAFDFDLLDPTKLIPEALVPVQRVGRMVLNRNPDNFFAENEQAAFHPGHIVPGIDFSNDPLLQGRLFSYTDTQISRLGGPNFHSLAERVDGEKIRQRSPSFGEYYAQPRLFWLSQTPIEQQHIIDGFSFELSKVVRTWIRERVVDHLAHIDTKLAEAVGANLGIELSDDQRNITLPAPVNGVEKDPSLSLYADAEGDVKGRVVAVLLNERTSAQDLVQLLQALQAQGVHSKLLYSRMGEVIADDGSPLPIAGTFAGSPSLTVDAVVVPGGDLSALSQSGDARYYLLEAYKHLKPILLAGDARQLTSVLHVPTQGEEGVIVTDALDTPAADKLLALMTAHRVWSRSPKIAAIPA